MEFNRGQRLGLLDLLDLELGGLLLGNETVGEVDLLGGSGGATKPSRGGEGGILAGSVGVDIVLEEVGFTRDGEVDGLDTAVVSLEQADDLTVGKVEGVLGHHGETEGGGLALEFADVVDLFRVIDDLVVTDVTVSLTTEENEGGVVIVEGDDLTGGGINVHGLEGLGGVARIPDAELTLGHLGEADGEELLLLTEEDDAGTLVTIVGLSLEGLSTRARIEDADGLVLARGGVGATIVVPGEALDEIAVTTDGEVGLTSGDIPDLDLKVCRGGGEDVLGDGVEVNGADLAPVADQILKGLTLGLLGTTGGDLPDLDVSIIGTRSNDGIIEGRESEIQNGGLVTREEGLAGVQLTI